MYKIKKIIFIASLMALTYSCFIPVTNIPDYSKAKAIFLLSSNTTNTDKIQIKIVNDTCIRGNVCEDNFEFLLSDGAKLILLYPGKNKITVIQFDKEGNKISEETKEVIVSDTSTKIEIDLQLNKLAVVTEVLPSSSPSPTTTITPTPSVVVPEITATPEVSPTPTPFRDRGGGGGGGGGGSVSTPTPPPITVDTTIIPDETSVK